MLEHLPHWLGAAFANVRAGPDTLALATTDLHGATPFLLSSPAFADGARLPDRFTADGAGLSPPLTWGAPPPGTATLLLVVEDPDAPLPRPLVHAIVADIDPASNGLAEGAISPDGDGGTAGDGTSGAVGDTGRNSYGREGWLPPDPPTGHGAHHYVFQLFALAQKPKLDSSPDRGDVRDALRDVRVLGLGTLTGTYSRGEEAPTGPAAAPVTA